MIALSQFSVPELIEYLSKQPGSQPVDLIDVIQHFNPFITDAKFSSIPLHQKHHNSGPKEADIRMLTTLIGFMPVVDNENNFNATQKVIRNSSNLFNEKLLNYCYNHLETNEYKYQLYYDINDLKKLTDTHQIHKITNNEYLKALKNAYVKLN